MSETGGLPLPKSLARHFGADLSGTNLSLLFDRGVNTYERSGTEWKFGGEEKKAFLESFRGRAHASAPGFRQRIDRLKASLGKLGAESVLAKASERLVVGLGLPHPTETALLLCRNVGVVYLPGSSVKGLLRATAALVAEGELPGASEFWEKHQEAIFGTGDEQLTIAARGEVAFYDAYPEAWPKLEFDLLTPHYGNYYSSRAVSSGVVPGDWGEPVSTIFLTVPAGTEFRFFYRLRKSTTDPARKEALDALFGTALDWLGVGGKTNAGYGHFTIVSQKESARGPVPGPGDIADWAGVVVKRFPQLGEIRAIHPDGRVAVGKASGFSVSLSRSQERKFTKGLSGSATVKGLVTGGLELLDFELG